mgnify:CR=1 FL=1
MSQIEGLGTSGVLPLSVSRRVKTKLDSLRPYGPMATPIMKICTQNQIQTQFEGGPHYRDYRDYRGHRGHRDGTIWTIGTVGTIGNIGTKLLRNIWIIGTPHPLAPGRKTRHEAQDAHLDAGGAATELTR